MPLAVIDVRDRIRAGGPDFIVSVAELQSWERRHGRIPAGGCVLLLTGYAHLFDEGRGEHSPYVTTAAPGFAGETVDWLFAARSIIATGSDTLGPDATMDAALQATTRTLLHAVSLWRMSVRSLRRCAHMGTGSPSTATGRHSAVSRWASPASPGVAVTDSPKAQIGRVDPRFSAGCPLRRSAVPAVLFARSGAVV
jgi:hypothetical protein